MEIERTAKQAERDFDRAVKEIVKSLKVTWTEYAGSEHGDEKIRGPFVSITLHDAVDLIEKAVEAHLDCTIETPEKAVRVEDFNGDIRINIDFMEG